MSDFERYMADLFKAQTEVKAVSAELSGEPLYRLDEVATVLGDIYHFLRADREVTVNDVAALARHLEA